MEAAAPPAVLTPRSSPATRPAAGPAARHHSALRSHRLASSQLERAEADEPSSHREAYARLQREWKARHSSAGRDSQLPVAASLQRIRRTAHKQRMERDFAAAVDRLSGLQHGRPALEAERSGVGGTTEPEWGLLLSPRGSSLEISQSTASATPGG